MIDLDAFLSGLSVRALDTLLFTGRPNQWENRHVYGGHIVAQAVEAAEATVEDRFHIHSLHCYFLRPGIADRDVIYDVDPIRNGASFCTRRVRAVQNGEAIFALSCSFHRQETGVGHFTEMPDVPPPEALDDDAAYFDKALRTLGHSGFQKVLPFDTRAIDRLDLENPQPKDPITGYWLKLQEPLKSDDARLHKRLLTYISDFAFLSANLRAHALITRDPRLKTVASLDHSMFYHDDDFRVDDWIYYHTEGHWAGGARGFSRGSLYTRGGRMIASTVQESLVRLKPDAKPGMGIE